MTIHHGDTHHQLDRRLADTLEALEWFEQSFHPPLIEKLQAALGPLAGEETPPLIEIHRAGGGPEAGEILAAAALLREALTLVLTASTTDINDLLGSLRRAFRKACRARETLFRHRESLPAVNLHFLEPWARGDAGRFGSDPSPGERGLIHLGCGEDHYARGALSLYVPEWRDDAGMPLVVALHGGHGHGRDFIWSMVREARSRGFILAAPTSMKDTWSLMKPERDLAAIREYIEMISGRWHVDTGRILATGFSDGASMALAAAQQEATPFTAFAPVSGAVPPGNAQLTYERRILWLHGSLDWMFSPQRAEREASLLSLAGAVMDFRIIQGQSHTFPRQATAAILEWFDPDLRIHSGSDPDSYR
jgi:phospholipase/carboxylesterase